MGNLDEPAGDAAPGDCNDLPLVPLFPLPNVVLFPRAVLPLHIFEERYRAMTRHALEGDRQIAMGLLQPGWEKSYYGRPTIEPVVCVGTILTHEELPDGKYNFLLQGTMRAQVVAEVGNEPYRLVRLRPIEEVAAPSAVQTAQRQELIDLFNGHPIAGTAMARQFTRILSTSMPTAEIVDLAAFTFIEDATAKQSLLAEADVARRMVNALELLRSAMQTVGPELALAEAPVLAPSRRFKNPSLN